MITTQELLSTLSLKNINHTVKYLHPTLYIIHVDEAYKELDFEQRVALLSGFLGIDTSRLISLQSSSSIELCLLTTVERETDYSFFDEENTRHHWIEALAGSRPNRAASQRSFKSLHFYGYKGGQGRSTVLGTLSKFLADQGYKILLIDADIEAPSLDKIFQTKTTRLSETLLGICHFNTKIDTANAYIQNTGKVDLIACRPESEIYDIDFASFSLNTVLDPILIRNGILKISQFAADEKYDFVFIDHRTGISSSVLPIVLTLPGPVISFARRDTQSASGTRAFRELLSINTEAPGLYVSFTIDPEFKRSNLSEESLKIQEELLMQFPESFRLEVEDAIDNYWIDWAYSKPLINGIIPDTKKINPENLFALRDICSVLGLLDEHPISEAQVKPKTGSALTSSGSTDGGIYLEANFLKRLLSPNSPITYILGRKGTGKTRLLRELHSRGLGRPILTAADYKHDGGIGSAAACFKQLIDKYRDKPETIWCTLLYCAIESDSSSIGKSEHLEKCITANLDTNINFLDLKESISANPTQKDHYTFLIDGIETAFPSSDIKKYIESLFSFLLTIQSDSYLSQKITIRLFIRSDLAKNAIENVEQQTDGREIQLVWDEQSIFNFVLLRICQNSWFRENFADACKLLQLEENALKNGSMTSDKYEPLLMEFFPPKLRASNIQTITFLKTYFSDTVDSTYSPRLYDRFLDYVAGDESRRARRGEEIEGGRLSQKLIMQAHKEASEYYLGEVSAELKHMLDPSIDVRKFTEGFNGLSTPFLLEGCIVELSNKTQLDVSLVRSSMNIMKDIGMFEARLGFSGQWRVGRLFKSSLGMKYVRGTKLT
ncbi:AAA family ATPase [Pseudomonas putida]|uniref:AAA family ATPase n=1 Tax=Pseudomonas putida TaxID=303 RepID=UPI0023673A62|nr:AAA family ATPase [Pseudomonas putida]MDD2046326.1 AAA family ATPase [Pseudomonas putida]